MSIKPISRFKVLVLVLSAATATQAAGSRGESAWLKEFSSGPIAASRSDLPGLPSCSSARLVESAQKIVSGRMIRSEERCAFAAAAYQGSGPAANALSLFYSKLPGGGAAALYWTMVAAENGDSVGQYNLALTYLDGASGRLSIPRAKFWLRQSASRGNSRAKSLLARLPKT